MKPNPALNQHTARPRSSQDDGIRTEKYNVTTGTLVCMKLEVTSNRSIHLLSEAKAFSRSILICEGYDPKDNIHILLFNAPASFVVFGARVPLNCGPLSFLRPN